MSAGIRFRAWWKNRRFPASNSAGLRKHLNVHYFIGEFMRRILFWLTIPIFFQSANLMIAQELPRVEVFGGYSYFRMPSEFSDNTAYAYTTEPARLNGWNINAVGNLNRWVGIEADFGGYYGEAAATYIHAPVPVDFVQDFDVHSYLFGPRLSLRKNRIITPFVHILLGGVSVSRMPVTNSPKSSSGTALGGGLDIRVARRFAVRAVQADYIKSSLTYYNEDNLRISVGGVFRF